MRRIDFPKTVIPSDCIVWQKRLGLSDAEAAEVLCLSDPERTFRRYKDEDGRKPAPPTIALMYAYQDVVQALIYLRTGRVFEAQTCLQRLMTPALARYVRAQAPGIEAIDAKRPAKK